jgi:hypothetical protein
MILDTRVNRLIRYSYRIYEQLLRFQDWDYPQVPLPKKDANRHLGKVRKPVHTVVMTGRERPRLRGTFRKVLSIYQISQREVVKER